MTAPAGPVIETTRTFTPLGVALHDLLTDAQVVDGLRVDARPLAGGRVTPAFRTRSGAYAFRGLDGMRSVEFPEPDSEPTGTPAGRDFLVAIVDVRGRFVATVLRVTVPTNGLVSRANVLPPGMPSSEHPSSPGDLPIYLFSSPSRVLPSQVAAVRAQLADAASGKPAAFCRLEVVVNAALPGRRRYVGIADETGAVLVPVAYPRFGSVPGSLVSSPEPGVRGRPPIDRSWPVEIRARYEPSVLDHHPGLPAPTLNSIFAQRETAVWATVEGAPHTLLRAEVSYGVDLIVRTAGDSESRVLIEGSSL